MRDASGSRWPSRTPDPPGLRDDALTGADPAEMVHDLGAALATLATSGARRAATRVVIADAEQWAVTRPGDVILGIAVPLHGPGMLRQVRAAAAAQASALIVRSDHALDEAAVTEAESGGLTLIVVDPRLPWERVYGLVHASIGSRVLASHEGGVPLGNMFELASAVSQLVGGPTILEDAHFRVIGYSAYSGESDPGRQAAILLRHIPPEWQAYLRSEGVLDRLRHTDDVMLLERGPLAARPRLITSVRSAGEMIGIIWVAEGDRPLDESSTERLRQALPMTVPHFQRYLAADRLGSSRHSELLRWLIEGRGDTVGVALELGLSLGSDYCLIAAFPAATRQSEAAAITGRERFAAYLECYDRTASCATLGDTLYGLAAVPGAADRRRLKSLATQLAADEANRQLAVVALSTPQPVSGDLTDALRELHILRELARSHAGTPRVIVGWENEAAVLAKRAERLLSTDHRFSFRKMTALEDYDAQRDSTLSDTLATYLSAGSSVSRAARALQIHHTTLRYRLQRIMELSGLALDDPAERLAAQLHLLATGRWPGASQPCG